MAETFASGFDDEVGVRGHEVRMVGHSTGNSTSAIPATIASIPYSIDHSRSDCTISLFFGWCLTTIEIR
jgi:hypothetical protein